MLQEINKLVVSIGIPAIIGAFIYIGVKLHTLKVIEEAVEKIKHNMKVMSDYLTRHHAKFNPSELVASSPLRLSEAGRKLIKEFGFDHWASISETNIWKNILK